MSYVLNVKIREPEKYNLTINESTKINVIVKEGGSGASYPYYEGEYELTPNFNEQILDTLHKSMKDDVIVHQIPYSETTNPFGGETLSIG